MRKEDIKSYIVKLKGFESEGSGVLVKSKKGNFYIFTAKHNFKTTQEQKVQDINSDDIKEDIDNGDVNILLPYSNIRIIDVIGLNDIFVDFIILVIDKENNKDLEKLYKKPLIIFNNSFKKCSVGGYPPDEVRNKSIEYFDCSYSSKYEKHEREDDYKYVFELKSNDNLYKSGKTEMDTISGISGGGVFVKDENGQIYLVGIEIEYIGIKSLIYVSLKEVIKEINQKLKKRFDDEIEVKSKTSNIDSNAKKYMIIFIICVLGYIFLNRNDKVNNSVQIVNKIDLKGRVVEDKPPYNIAIKKVRVKLFINGHYNRDTYTNSDGNFTIKNISFIENIKLCYEKRGYQENYCLPYKQKDYHVFLPKK